MQRHGCGFVVPFRDPGAAADAVLRLHRDPGLRAELGQCGHRGAAEQLGWPADARAFVAQLEQWAAAGAAATGAAGGDAVAAGPPFNGAQPLAAAAAKRPRQ